MKQVRIRSRILGILLVAVCIMTGCGHPFGDGYSRSEIAAVNLVTDRIWPYIKSNPEAFMMVLEMHEIDDGCAVLLLRFTDKKVDAAFWVRDGEVFTVNEAARVIAPTFDAAPSAITFERVKAVVH